MNRRRSFALVLVVSAFVTSPALAADRDACVDAATDGQTSRDRGELLAARTQFVACAQSSCPPVVASACEKWLADTEKRIPRVVFRVEDAAGMDVADAMIAIDGRARARVTGRPMELDPGQHHVRFEAEGRPAVEQDVLLAEGEKTRIVIAHLPAARPRVPVHEEPALASAPLPTAFWIAGGIGLVSLGGAAYFGLTGIGNASSKRDSCGPRCPPDDKEDIQTKLLVADVLLGVGLVALGVAAYLALTRSPQRAPISTSSTTMSMP